MYLRVPLYKHRFCSTYGYFCTSLSSVTPTVDLNKYESAISTCISLLYEFMKILISANEYLLLLYAYCTRVSIHVYIYKSYVSH